MKGRYQGVPRAGPKRERLREKGQFWTPDWLAEAMVAYVIADGCDHIFDPAVGEGAFFRSAKGISARTGKLLRLVGTEIDPAVLHQALCSGLSEDDLSSVKITDFVLQPPRYSYSAIVANPPYIRHHRLPPHVKAELRKLSTQLVGKALDGRAGLHIYFLIRALQLLAPYGRLAFIMPADTCEGVFAGALWEWITKNYCLEAVITFSPEASPFPGVDTNPVIFLRKSVV